MVKTKVEEREKILNKFEAGEEFVLIASTILDEGIDLKNVNRVIMGGGGSFLMLKFYKE